MVWVALAVLINTIMTRISLLSVSVLALVASPITALAGDVSSSAVIREMNLARQNPAAYAAHLEEIRAHFNGRYFVLPGKTRINTREGVGALDDAIRFLHSARPLQPFTLSEGMSRSAADHCAAQAGGKTGHGNTARRLNQHGKWAGAWGENISYGKTTARDIVIALIIDDGLPARKHRANIFAAKFNYAGAAYGSHARYGSMCAIDFAGAYLERGGQRTDTLVARR